MPFLILSCPAPIPHEQCEARIRSMLIPYGEVGRIIVAQRSAEDQPWTAAVEMRSGVSDALAALHGSTFDGEPLRIRAATPVDAAMLMRA
jgi:hypothetical protein